MKNLLYDILLHISILVAAPYFFVKMLTSHKYRDGIMERFGIYKTGLLDPFKGGHTVWFHAISVGETKAAAPVLRALRSRNPGLRVFFTTVTLTGRRTAEHDCQGLIDALVYFPLDLSWVVSGLIRRLRPAAFITVEKDIWPNTFTRLAAADVPVVIINGTLSDRSTRRFARFGFFFKDVFGSVAAFCARTPEDSVKAARVGIVPERIHTTGNIKFDIHPASIDAKAAAALADELGIRPGEPVLTAGSTHAGEEEIILRVYSKLRARVPKLRLVLAPRHPERFNEVAALVKRSGLAYGRRTQGPTDGVVILDTVGELMRVWSFTDAAFVGGSLVPGIGGHNLLEPAFFGRPVLCGPHLGAYLSMAELLEAVEAGGRVDDEAALVDTLVKILTDGALRSGMGAAAKAVVEANRGAALKSVEIIERLIAGS